VGDSLGEGEGEEGGRRKRTQKASMTISDCFDLPTTLALPSDAAIPIQTKCAVVENACVRDDQRPGRGKGRKSKNEPIM
jgi:hypothetical protein